MDAEKRGNSKPAEKDVIPYGKQTIDQNDINEVIKVLKSPIITQGELSRKFEKKICSFTKAKYATSFSSGTGALYCAVAALKLKPGSKIITTPMTFVSSANAIIANHLEPVFADIEPDTGNISTEEVKKIIFKEKDISAILAVDYAGHPCNWSLLKDFELPVIEDGCHALGAECDNKPTGSYADMTVFSFHPVKHITTGEGGAVTTNNIEHDRLLKILRANGIIRDPEYFSNTHENNRTHPGYYYEMHYLSNNYRITEFQCALGISQFKKLPHFIEKRRNLASDYNSILYRLKSFLECPKEKNYAKHSYHLYPVLLKDAENSNKRDVLYNFMREKNILSQVHYIPVYKHPFYIKYLQKSISLQETERFFNRVLSLPLYPHLSDTELRYVCDVLEDFFKSNVQ